MARNTYKIYLLKNFPLVDNSNVYWNGDYNEMLQTFMKFNTGTNGVDVFEMGQFNLQNGYIQVPMTYQATFLYNYMIVYDAISKERYFMFIRNVDWDANLRTCKLIYEIDMFSTYFNRIKFYQSYVERETVNDDTFGKHIIDEGLGVHDYYASFVQNFGIQSYQVAMTISDTSHFYGSSAPEAKQIPAVINVSQKEYSTAIIYGDHATMTNIINAMVEDNKQDAIVSVYLIPSDALPSTELYAEYRFDDWDAQTNPTRFMSCFRIGNKTSPATFIEKTYTRPSTLNGYTPKNNKCFCYPFTVARITNNLGSSIESKFELANDNTTIRFKYAMSPMHAGTGYGFLCNYNGVAENNDYSITTISNPDLPYITSQYAAYMASNRNSLTNSLNYISSDVAFSRRQADIDYQQAGASRTMSQAASMLSPLSILDTFKNAANNVAAQAGALTDLTQTYETIEYNAGKQRDAIQASLGDIASKGSISRGVFSTNGVLMSNNNGFKFEIMAPEYEEIKAIDEYFTRFGYKVNTFKVPQFLNRTNFDYVLLKEVNCTGTVPIDALNVIKNMLVSGVTVWHNINTIYDYTVNNNIR